MSPALWCGKTVELVASCTGSLLMMDKRPGSAVDDRCRLLVLAAAVSLMVDGEVAAVGVLDVFTFSGTTLVVVVEAEGD